LRLAFSEKKISVEIYMCAVCAKHNILINTEESNAKGQLCAKRLSFDDALSARTFVSLRADEEGNVVMEKEPFMIAVLESANVDGTRHLNSPSKLTRYMWTAIIVVFVFLAAVQIWRQIVMYIETPVATNIEAFYPEKLPFPAVAICNNNQFRLTYLTGPLIQNRRAKEMPADENNINDALMRTKSKVDVVNSTVFDQVIERAWDMDAVKFLRNAAHWKSRMILRCTWPNGTSCRLSDFKAVWTLTGLCWAINTNAQNPHYISSSGSGHGLRLLLNIERYERVESCTPKFRTMSLPGLKILIYNQTTIPESSLSGVNVPPGYSMDIPFRIQHRSKIPGMGCIQMNDQQKGNALAFDDPLNVHTCSIRNFLREIERSCNCSMRRAYNPNINGGAYGFCNVKQYFGCVSSIIKGKTEFEKDKFKLKCVNDCEQIDYIAWQDMNLLPSSIFPSLIDTAEEEDVDDVLDNEDEEWKFLEDASKDELFQCEESQLLSEEQVRQIKRSAQRAYEKQSRYQEDIQLRTKRLIDKLRNATQNLLQLRWGWTDKTYLGAYQRLNTSLLCYSNMAANHKEMSTAISNVPVISEQRRTSNIFRVNLIEQCVIDMRIFFMSMQLLSPKTHERNPEKYKTLAELRQVYGERVDEIIKESQAIGDIVEAFWRIYRKETFTSTLGVNLDRMDTILQLTDAYELGKLQRRAWAEKMQSRNMRHFFDQDFYEGWYNPTLKDFDQVLVRNIINIEENDLPFLLNSIQNGTGLQIASVLYFGNVSQEHMKQFNDFLKDVIQCTMNDVKNKGSDLLKTFKKAMHEFQNYNDIGVQISRPLTSRISADRQNFAMVNIFLHKMNVESWRQEGTYSIWSLMCDVGGALGLFLGASMLTIIELVYLSCQYIFTEDSCRQPESLKKRFRRWRSKLKNVELATKSSMVEGSSLGIENSRLKKNQSDNLLTKAIRSRNSFNDTKAHLYAKKKHNDRSCVGRSISEVIRKSQMRTDDSNDQSDEQKQLMSSPISNENNIDEDEQLMDKIRSVDNVRDESSSAHRSCYVTGSEGDDIMVHSVQSDNADESCMSNAERFESHATSADTSAASSVTSGNHQHPTLFIPKIERQTIV
uniref:Degenerin-like protein (inferred by orthology to a C. elegans protein) n=1 Tax=Anisakis simplex TaxID=6269 RepID=A0A0M3JVQ8_ANISI